MGFTPSSSVSQSTLDTALALKASLDLAGATIFPNKGSIGGIDRKTIGAGLTKRLIHASDLGITKQVVEVVPAAGCFIQLPTVSTSTGADQVIRGWNLVVINNQSTHALGIKDSGGNDTGATVDADTSAGFYATSTDGIIMMTMGVTQALQ
jgi:hypothetical protein